MKTKNVIFSLLVFLIIAGCSSNNKFPNWSAVSCLDLGVNIKLIDKTTGVNYLESE